MAAATAKTHEIIINPRDQPGPGLHKPTQLSVSLLFLQAASQPVLQAAQQQWLHMLGCGGNAGQEVIAVAAATAKTHKIIITHEISQALACTN